MNITYFGTGARINFYVDTTHFLIEENEKQLFVDAGAGPSLMQRVFRGEVKMPEFLYITHCHSDHFLGLPHLLSIVRTAPITLIATDQTLQNIESVMHMIGKGQSYQEKREEGLINYITIEDDKIIHLYDWKLTPINLYSKKLEQYGFQLQTPTKNVVFFGDEAIDVMERDDLELFMGCDVLLCETFCADIDKDTFDPYPKGHVTSLDAAAIANRIESKSLIVSHISERVKINRDQQRENIANEIAGSYSGSVFVPADNDTVVI